VPHETLIKYICIYIYLPNIYLRDWTQWFVRSPTCISTEPGIVNCLTNWQDIMCPDSTHVPSSHVTAVQTNTRLRCDCGADKHTVALRSIALQLARSSRTCYWCSPAMRFTWHSSWQLKQQTLQVDLHYMTSALPKLSWQRRK